MRMRTVTCIIVRAAVIVLDNNVTYTGTRAAMTMVMGVVSCTGA